MKQILRAVVITGGLMAGTIANDVMADNGEQLHASKCQGCHDSSVYTRANRFIQNRDALHKQVSRCDKQVRAEWTALQIDDVVNYLDKKYYKF